uniref:Uncharacterized protein n=1 Tax=Micrurus spixii TaxID=129469 RepID=A0A2D4M6E8_9SAUR
MFCSKDLKKILYLSTLCCLWKDILRSGFLICCIKISIPFSPNYHILLSILVYLITQRMGDTFKSVILILQAYNIGIAGNRVVNSAGEYISSQMYTMLYFSKDVLILKAD